MSTISSAIFNNSDDEDDVDYVPKVDADSDSENETSAMVGISAGIEKDSEEERAKKEAEEAARRSLWESFQATVSKGGSSSKSSTSASKPKLLQIEKKYRFAGELVSEVVTVPEDSEDAKLWPLWDSSTGAIKEKQAVNQEENSQSNSSASRITETNNRIVSDEVAQSSTSTIETPNATTSTQSGVSKVRRPGPRKPKGTLPPLPSSKPKKLTTLEKSAMDWKAHIASNSGEEESSGSLADELEKNRRGGGYLERVAFLERVSARREEIYEEGRRKRRKV